MAIGKNPLFKEKSPSAVNAFTDEVVVDMKHLRRTPKSRLVIDHNEHIFTKIYSNNEWGSPESVSGPGSTLEYTKTIREELPTILNSLGVTSIFNALCGDFNWMKAVVTNGDYKYIGGDIVRPLSKRLKQKHKGPRSKFRHIDITKGRYPKADLMICRDCLFHLSKEDIKSVLNNFLKSKIKYLATSSHVNEETFVNSDIDSGGFRLLDLTTAPHSKALHRLRL